MKTILLSALAAATLLTAGCRTVAVAVHDEPVRTARVSHHHDHDRGYYNHGRSRDWGYRSSDRYHGRSYGRSSRTRTIVY